MKRTGFLYMCKTLLWRPDDPCKGGRRAVWRGSGVVQTDPALHPGTSHSSAPRAMTGCTHGPPAMVLPPPDLHKSYIHLHHPGAQETPQTHISRALRASTPVRIQSPIPEILSCYNELRGFGPAAFQRRVRSASQVLSLIWFDIKFNVELALLCPGYRLPLW